MTNTSATSSHAALFSLLLAFSLPFDVRGAESEIVLERAEGKIIVSIDGQLFTEYIYEGHAKPILYPIIGPHGVKMTRAYPMVEDVDNEARDHPHHESLWFTHDEVNGVNFWSARLDRGENGRSARIRQSSIALQGNSIRSENEWLAPGDQIVCTDTTLIAFGATPVGRYIDYQVTIHASQDDVTFGDTKEGTMAIRTHPKLRLSADKRRGNHTAAGHAVNSEGHTDNELWGKRAKWVDYWAPIDGNVVGIAIFDHLDNPRHPTWWHARNYGLVAANPFGIHDFENKPKSTGDMLLKKNTSVTFRYRFLFHEGNSQSANIEQQYAQFAGDSK